MFSGQLFNQTQVFIVIKAFILFSVLCSSVYLINDVMDAPKDRKHPFKKLRPIAKGDLPAWLALAIATVMVTFVLVASYALSFFFYVTVLSYLLLQLAYSLLLKQIVIMDILIIAAGFILRVYAGAFVIDAHLNVWFLLTVISVALFLASGKRRFELTILSGVTGETPSSHRSTLSLYSEKILDMYTNMFATSTWITYAIFTFQETPPVPSYGTLQLFSILPSTLEQRKWLMLTVPLVIYGVMRYLQVIYHKRSGESPERVLLSDSTLLGTVAVWVLLVIFIIYILSR